MNNELVIEDEPRLEEVAALDDRLYRHNVVVTGCDGGRWLAIFVRDATGEMMAGLHGWTWGRTGFVRTLWVREDLRGRGLGARLLMAAEGEATRAAAGRYSSTPTGTRRPASTGARATSRSASCPAGPARRPRASSSGRRSDR